MEKLTDSLHELVFKVTPLVLTEEYEHMRDPWEMILGGLVGPLIAKEDPDTAKQFESLMEQYSKDKIIEFFAPKVIEKEKIVEKEVEKIVEKIVEKEVEKIVEKPVIIEKIVEKTVSGQPTGKFRRLKDEVKKESRMKRAISPIDRDTVIAYWNTTQKLVDKDSPVFTEMADQLNKNSSEPIAPLQLAGYFSDICRMGLLTEGDRNNRIARQMSKGMYTIEPIYTPQGHKEIIDNYQLQREDEAARRKDHERLRDAKAQGKKLKIRSSAALETTPAALPTPTPQDEETFDIKYL